MKILILGIGNIILSDEGIGVHMCNFLRKKYHFTSKYHTIDFIDGGTLAQALTPIIAKYDYLILLDCIEADDSKIGEVYFFDFENIPNNISYRSSAHELEMLQTLKMMDILGDRPTTKIVGIVPKIIVDPSFNLSEEVLNGAKIMEKIVLKHLSDLDVDHTIKSDISLQKLAFDSYKGV